MHTVVVEIPNFSDGDPTCRPSRANCTLVSPPTIYLEKIGAQWMQHLNRAKPGVKYVLERLPLGYELYERDRSSGQVRSDKWLYGHPSGRFFDSPNRFWPHFRHLVENEGVNIGCPCTVCQVRGSRQSSHRPPYQPKPAIKKEFLDEEGTPDVYRALIDKLKANGKVDEPIVENMSMDWRAENLLLEEQIDETSKQPLWVPRRGEIVLVLRNLAAHQHIYYLQEEQEFKLYDDNTKQDTEFPPWEAGVVTQCSTENHNARELTFDNPDKAMAINYSGYRVELLPDPNSSDKRLSQRYKYVTLRQIRPFVFWGQYLHNIPDEKWHETMKNAFTIMSTLSLLKRHHFRGGWPEADIHCKGIYMGSELLLIGDYVRLIPRGGIESAAVPESLSLTEIMHISDIRLHMYNLHKANDDDYDDGHPHNSKIFVLGKVFTVVRDDAFAGSACANWLLPPGIAHYADWYPKHDHKLDYQIHFTRLLGRCYEEEAMVQWFPPLSEDDSDRLTDLNRGVASVIQARLYAKKRDQRVESGKGWYLAECRADALDLRSINDQEVARFDRERDPEAWRKHIRIMEGVAEGADRRELQQVEAVRKHRRDLQGSSMVTAIQVDTETETDTDAAVSRESTVPRKRAYADMGREGTESLDDYDMSEGSLRIFPEPSRRTRVEVVVD